MGITEIWDLRGWEGITPSFSLVKDEEIAGREQRVAAAAHKQPGEGLIGSLPKRVRTDQSVE